jgi:hypothetical protein
MLTIEAVCVGSIVAAVAWRVSRAEPAVWRRLPEAATQVKKWS